MCRKMTCLALAGNCGGRFAKRIRRRGEPQRCAALAQQHRQRHAAQADVALVQKVPPRDAVQIFVSWIHGIIRGHIDRLCISFNVSSRFNSTLLTTVHAASSAMLLAIFGVRRVRWSPSPRPPRASCS